MMNPDGIFWQIATIAIPMILAIVFHEVAHGWVARALGDPTAAEQKRLSLNPLRHVDPFGTIILPGLLKLSGAPVFGWAKPVPVDFNRLRNPRWGMVAVAAAGPVTNFVLAAFAAIALGLLVRATDFAAEPGLGVLFLADNLRNFLIVNLFLGAFNLLPIPPFDGSRIVMGILPAPLARGYARLEPFGLIIVFGFLVILPYFMPELRLVERLIGPPVQWLGEHLAGLAGLIAGPEPQ